MIDLTTRLRRLRGTAGVRRLVAESALRVDDLVYPVFVHEGAADVAVAAMPGVYRYCLESLWRVAEEAAALGIPMVAVFPAIADERKDARGSAALDEDGLVARAARGLKERFPELLVMTDVALDPYTSHGHDGLLAADGEVLNDETVALLARQALVCAAAGADVVAPSDMMDGRVGAIRAALDGAGFGRVLILAYAAKYASAFYGPFREAVGSAAKLLGDKRTYQMNPANAKEAMREIGQDVAEGADMVMVKPGQPYLDVVAAAAARFDLPVLAYQVSGEYAAIMAAAGNGWLDGEAAMMESLLGFKRAGAAAVLTYYARQAAKILARQSSG